MNGKFNTVMKRIDLEANRLKAELYIDAYYEQGMEIKDLFEHIWFASTEILNGLEVQVVIDSNDAIHISSGSAGYVDFQIDPVGMKLPIKCWIHTHPFGSAYFSGTDIRTVSIWQPLMKTAYVLGGDGHYGSWNQKEPYLLDIYRNHEYERTQVWVRKGDEEE
jgi:proteasome lid subunit RPN8/RPN11|tara:strand:+ start:103 stop:591 length:489 start_codon:yes stop_codon:yes gene_type:complete